MAIDVESLRSERDRLKELLRQLEADARRLEAETKAVRQREIQTKREIEALSVLVEIHEGRSAKPEKSDA